MNFLLNISLSSSLSFLFLSSLNSLSLLHSEVILRSSSSISKTDELADDLFEEFFCWLSNKWSHCSDLIQKAKKYFCKKKYELDQLHRFSVIQLNQLNIDMKIYEMIQESLNDSEWRKHARDFIRLQTAKDSIASSTAGSPTARSLTVRSSTVKSDDEL